MSRRSGWLEKWSKGRMVSMVEASYRRVGVKKTPRKKLFKKEVVAPNEDLYYILDKKVRLGELSLTGGSVFSPKELVEVELQVSQYQVRMRLLGKILKVTTFVELKRPVFRGEIHFSAVNKEDFDHLVALDDERKKREAEWATRGQSSPLKETHKVTFKRS